MSREILLLYQDCPMCGVHAAWGAKQMEIAKKNKLVFREVSFITPEAIKARYMQNAVKKGIRSYPFFTDGVKFSRSLADFIEEKPSAPQKPAKSVKKSTKKAAQSKKSTRKNKTEVADGNKAKN
ncbi:hypothetical protein IJH02_03250 [Candidatus Saccharibacteria bacterium]|nr:hypothetical protein [Candidatus Saccharibacteria bacterium]